MCLSMGLCKEGKAGFLSGAPYPCVSVSWSSVWAELQLSAKNNSMTLRQLLPLSVVKDKGVILGFATQLLISTCSIWQARQITRHLTSLLLGTASSCFKSFLALQWQSSLRIQWENPWLFQMYIFFYAGVVTGMQKEISHHSQGGAASEVFDMWLFPLFDWIMLLISTRLNCSKRDVLEEMKGDAQIQARKQFRAVHTHFKWRVSQHFARSGWCCDAD